MVSKIGFVVGCLALLMSAQALTVQKVQFLGSIQLSTGLTFQDTPVGGLSGLGYNPKLNLFYAISDDRSEKAPARFYTFRLDVQKKAWLPEDIQFQQVVTLRDEQGSNFTAGKIDGEGIAISKQGQVFISSEGGVESGVDPFVGEFNLTGLKLRSLPLPSKFLPLKKVRGVRDNLAFESLTLSPSQRFLYTATEGALVQDGAEANREQGSKSRILQFDLTTGRANKEFLYITEPIPKVRGVGGVNGLVDLLALDEENTFISVERAYIIGAGNVIRLFEVSTAQATDIHNQEQVTDQTIIPVKKRLLIDLSQLNIKLDNIEGLTLGPTLANGQQTLLLVSDNNFNPLQFTQFILLGLTIN